MKEYSHNTQRLIEQLSEDEILQLRKDNPFKVERNDKIRALRRRGVTMLVLAEISGMSGTAISRICKDIQNVKCFARPKGE